MSRLRFLQWSVAGRNEAILILGVFGPSLTTSSSSPTATVTSLIAGRGPGIAHGLGRSDGDACLNPGAMLWRMAGLDRFTSFDARTASPRDC
jgi:hypothetical protein